MSAKITREMLEDRWRMATTDVGRDVGGTFSWTNAKRWTRADEAIEELAVRLVDEVTEDERAELLSLTENLWAYIESQTINWAKAILDARELRRERAA